MQFTAFHLFLPFLQSCCIMNVCVLCLLAFDSLQQFWGSFARLWVLLNCDFIVNLSFLWVMSLSSVPGLKCCSFKVYFYVCSQIGDNFIFVTHIKKKICWKRLGIKKKKSYNLSPNCTSYFQQFQAVWSKSALMKDEKYIFKDEPRHNASMHFSNRMTGGEAGSLW